MIQENVNNLINQAAILGRLSPGYDERQAKYQAKKEAQNISKLKGSFEKNVGELSPEEATKRIEQENLLNIPQKQAELAQKEAELGIRTPENAAEIKKQAQISQDLNKLLQQKKVKIVPFQQQNSLQERQKVANQKATDVREAQKNQRRNFKEYLSKQPTSLGGTVGDLPPNMQKQIASQYTKSQRRTMMNEMDKEKMNKDGK